MNGSRKLLISIFITLATAGIAAANDIYVAQNALGGSTGADCSNARAYTYFNSSSNWGTGSTQIGPGSIVHICGTITGAAGANFFTFQGSGSSGNPVTLRWEPGAIVQAPYLSTNGGIVANGRNWIVIDGGTNGVLRATLNGSSGASCPGGGCSSQQDSVGIYIQNGTNVTIRNLEIGPIYYRVNTESTSGGGTGIYLN